MVCKEMKTIMDNGRAYSRRRLKRQLNEDVLCLKKQAKHKEEQIKNERTLEKRQKIKK